MLQGRKAMDSFKKWMARRHSIAGGGRKRSMAVLAALRSIHLTRSSIIVAACVLCVSLLYWSAQSADDESTELSEDAYATATSELAKAPAPANSETAATLTHNLPASTPEYFRKTYLSFMAAPLPKKIYNQGGIPKFVPQLEIDGNPFGKLGSYQPDGPTKTSENAFFEDLGENGRACVTCHQPPSGMSVSVRNIKKRMNATGGKDPIFAAVDGANCPDLVPESETSGAIYGGLKGKGKKAFKEAHSLLHLQCRRLQ